MTLPDLLVKLATAGVSPELLAEVRKLAAPIEARRASDRERASRYRAKSRDPSRDDHVTVPLARIDNSLSSFTSQPVREEKKVRTPIVPKASRDADFDAFWSLYPRKVSKQAAIKAYAKAVESAAPEVILAGLERYVAELERLGKLKTEFVKHAATFLNGKCWEDSYDRQSEPRRYNAFEAIDRAIAKIESEGEEGPCLEFGESDPEPLYDDYPNITRLHSRTR